MKPVEHYMKYFCFLFMYFRRYLSDSINSQLCVLIKLIDTMDSLKWQTM